MQERSLQITEQTLDSKDLRVRRLAAFGVDAGLVGFSAMAIHPWIASLVSDVRNLPLSALPGILAMGAMVGLSGRSPGKRLFSLVVAGDSGPLTPTRGILRELVKFLSLPILILPVLYLFTWLQGERLPYDKFLGSKVDEGRHQP